MDSVLSVSPFSMGPCVVGIHCFSMAITYSALLSEGSSTMMAAFTYAFVHFMNTPFDDDGFFPTPSCISGGVRIPLVLPRNLFTAVVIGCNACMATPQEPGVSRGNGGALFYYIVFALILGGPKSLHNDDE